MRFRLALLLSLLGGFVALSYEIVWFRVYSFMSWGRANAFGLLLGAYLAGIAFGSFLARRYCEGRRELRALALFLLFANLAGFLLVPALAELVRFASHAWALPAFGFVAALLGTAFPLVAHAGIPDGDRVGARLSYLYLANIVGSAAGSLGTGFLLFDVWPLRGVCVLLALLGLLMAAGVALLSGWPRRAVAGVTAAAAAAVWFAAAPLFGGLYEKLTFKDEYRPGQRFELVVENRSGVVALGENGTVYGGGVYDGRFNVDPAADTNGIVRAYAVAALHAAPKDVLVVGLGSGAWAQVLAHHPAVERVTAIEINPGYLELLARSPVVASLLTNPKVEIVADDGRRWLARTERRFDAIVQNTTYHFRSHITNLLSREYLLMCRARLKPGGLLLYNTTWSKDAQKTGLAVFPHAWRIENCMVVSDAPLRRDLARWRRILADYAIDGRRVLAGPAAVEGVLARARWADRAELEEHTRDARVITDDNMATEWR